jgi:hypothetical protein
VSALKAMRRTLVAELEPKMLATLRHVTTAGSAVENVRGAALALKPKRSWAPPTTPTLVALVRTPAQLEAVIDAGLKEV